MHSSQDGINQRSCRVMSLKITVPLLPEIKKAARQLGGLSFKGE